MRKVLSGLEIQERRAFRKLTDAFETARNRDSVTRRDRLLVRPSVASELNAGNPFSRILLGNALWSEYVDHFGLSETQPLPDFPIYWVTLVDSGCMTPLDAESIDVASMTRQLRHGLEGLSYFGFMDLALYANIQP